MGVRVGSNSDSSPYRRTIYNVASVRRAFPVAYNDLREWIGALERAGELRRIKMEVDPVLEITEIADRVSKAGRQDHASLESYSEPGGPALLFESIKGQPGAKVLINQFGSAKRMKLA